MDTTLREYQRKMAAGEGSMQQYLRLLARSGYTINHALNDHHHSMVEKHLTKNGSADFSPLGYDKMTPTIETLRFMLETGLANKCLIVCPAARIAARQYRPSGETHPRCALPRRARTTAPRRRRV